MKPKISIITISYNSEKHLEEAIQSVVSQDYDNFEYLIIDGGSTDGTLDIVKKYEDSISYFVSEKDNGISDAFNKGIRASTGDIIGICNSDDVMAKGVLKIIADNYDPQVDIYRLNEIIKDFDTGEEFLLRPTLSIPKLPFTSKSCHFGCYITKDAYNKYGLYDGKMRVCMDLDILRRFTYYNARYKYIPEVCGYFRKGGTSSCPESKMRSDRKRLVLKYGGNRFDVLVLLTFFILKDALKNFLNLFGQGFASKIKYKING